MTVAGANARLAVLGAAAELFLEHGFDAVSMDQVRLQAGVSNGSLYHHFPTKAQLARGVYLGALADYQAALMPAIGSGVGARAGVRALVTGHIEWVLRQPRLARVLERLRPLTALDGEAPDWEAVNAEAFQHLKSWIAAQVAQGTMRRLPTSVWLALVLGPSMQLTAGWARMAQPAVDPAVRRALAQAAWLAVQAPPAR